LKTNTYKKCLDFALPMISRTYDRAAKSLVSRGERLLSLSVLFRPRRGPKRNGRENGGVEAAAAKG
jgi:hypothetical protein